MMKERYAKEIVNGFPYPIASIFVKLRTDECLDPGPHRLKYLLATGEATARFLGVVSLCQARDYQEQANKTPPATLATGFKTKFKTIGWGNWLHIARESLRWLHQEQAELFVSEMNPDFSKKHLQDSDAPLIRLLSLRNGLNHERIKAMLPHEYQNLCEQAQADLEDLLQELAFLLDYELTFVSEIDVQKRRRYEPTYSHRFKLLAGNSDDFEGSRLNSKNLLDSDAVILRRQNQQAERHLNLDPLLLYEAKAGKAADIFFYNGMADLPRKAEYVACKHGGHFIGEQSGRFEQLNEELGLLLSLFGQDAQAELET